MAKAKAIGLKIAFLDGTEKQELFANPKEGAARKAFWIGDGRVEYVDWLLEDFERKAKLAAIWRATAGDYRADYRGVKYVMVLRGGTCSVPLASLTDAEIEYHLPKDFT